MQVEKSGDTLCPRDDLITAACLDSPGPGPVDGYAFVVNGWVVSKVPVAEVEFVHEEIVVARSELTVSRPDVASVYGSSSLVGFWKAIGTVGLAPAFTIGVRVVLQDGRRRWIAEIRGTQQLTSAFTPSMQPIMVTSPRRSGSTLLMRMLAEHPDIIVHERFPYETRVCNYWMHFIQVLARPMDTSLELHEFWRDPKRLPPFPYFFIDPATGPIPPEQATLDRWYATDQVEEFAHVAQATVESFYREYAGTRNRTTPAFFAEKIVPAGHVRWIMRQLYPQAREIFLVRDPRDTLASVLAFHARHGVADGFGVQSVETDEQLVGLVRESILATTQLWKGRSQYGTLVRYEDLVRSPTEQIRAMLDALELDSSANIVDSMVKAGNEATADVNAHRTSPGGPSSIGRWKRDLEPRLQKICDEAFGGLLDELGTDGGIAAEMDAHWEPGLDDPFEEAIDEALSSLPADLRAEISNVAIVVEDEPPDGRLLGLYSGVPLLQRGWPPIGIFPAKVSIFRGPITRLAAGDADCLRREVRHVVLHELAHYFEIE